MSQQEVDYIYNEVIEELRLADDIIKQLDFLRKEKNQYDYMFMRDERVAAKNKITKPIQPTEHAHPLTVPTSTHLDFSEYVGKLETVCIQINKLIVDLHDSNIKLNGIFKFINLKVVENQELAFKNTAIRAKMFTIRTMLDEINEWIISFISNKKTILSNKPIDFDLNVEKMNGLHNTIIQFVDAIGLNIGIADSFKLLFERLKKGKTMRTCQRPKFVPKTVKQIEAMDRYHVINKVIKRILELTPEALEMELKAHGDGDIARILVESGAMDLIMEDLKKIREKVEQNGNK